MSRVTSYNCDECREAQEPADLYRLRVEKRLHSESFEPLYSSELDLCRRCMAKVNLFTSAKDSNEFPTPVPAPSALEVIDHLAEVLRRLEGGD